MRFFWIFLIGLMSMITVGYVGPVFPYVSDNLSFITSWGSGYTEKTYTVPSIDYKMVYIKPGTFMMGSPSNEPGRGNDERQHKVTLTRGFYMGTTEVTQKQWRTIMGSNPSRFKGDNRPVEHVSWNDVHEFIRKLNQREGTDKYRLPTEAEWEYACRAGTGTAFNWGMKPDCKKANYGCWTKKAGCLFPKWVPAGECAGYNPGKTRLVKSYPPNAWGLYDMHGNVWEWCQDWQWDYPTGHVTDPKGPSSGKWRVLRGGCWNNNASYVRSAYRESPEWNDSFGLRVARDL